MNVRCTGCTTLSNTCADILDTVSERCLDVDLRGLSIAVIMSAVFMALNKRIPVPKAVRGTTTLTPWTLILLFDGQAHRESQACLLDEATRMIRLPQPFLLRLHKGLTIPLTLQHWACPLLLRFQSPWLITLSNRSWPRRVFLLMADLADLSAEMHESSFRRFRPLFLLWLVVPVWVLQVISKSLRKAVLPLSRRDPWITACIVKGSSSLLTVCHRRQIRHHPSWIRSPLSLTFCDVLMGM